MIALLFAAILSGEATTHADACALVANEEVHRILGVDVKERQPGTQQARGLLLSQCYLGTGTPRSVSIAVAGPARSGGRTVTPRAFWREQFHGTKEGPKEREENGPRPVTGLGDEAFWSGGRVAGALYVLRGKTFIRVSVGGIGDERDRIEKSRQLAVAALGRLR